MSSDNSKSVNENMSSKRRRLLNTYEFDFDSAINLKIDKPFPDSTQDNDTSISPNIIYDWKALDEQKENDSNVPISSCSITDTESNYCFVKLEPLILLPNNFTTQKPLSKVIGLIEEILKNSEDTTFTSIDSTWYGNISDIEFKFNVYKSKRDKNILIIEGQRIRGDGFEFGDLFKKIKEIVDTDV